MTDERIDPKAIEAAKTALIENRDMPFATAAEAAIRVADRERGLKEERKLRMAGAPEEPWDGSVRP